MVFEFVWCNDAWGSVEVRCWHQRYASLISLYGHFRRYLYFIFVVSFHRHGTACRVGLLYSSHIYTLNLIPLTSVVIHTLCLT